MSWTRWITFWRVLAVLAIALIWIGSLWPANELRQFDVSWFNDKVGHWLGYLTVALLLALGWRQSPPWLLWLIATLSGALAELAQGNPDDCKDQDDGGAEQEKQPQEQGIPDPVQQGCHLSVPTNV